MTDSSFNHRPEKARQGSSRLPDAHSGWASSARLTPTADSRSSWSCIQTVWYESQRGEASQARSSLILSRASVSRAPVLGEPGHRLRQRLDQGPRPLVEPVEPLEDLEVVGGIGVVVGLVAGLQLPVGADAQELDVERRGSARRCSWPAPPPRSRASSRAQAACASRPAGARARLAPRTRTRPAADSSSSAGPTLGGTEPAEAEIVEEGPGLLAQGRKRTLSDVCAHGEPC